MVTMIAIGIDLGGTRIKAAAINASGNILQSRYYPTYDGDGSVWKQTIAGIVTDITGNIQEENFIIGISAPGLPDAGNNTIVCMPGRLQGLEHFNWSSWLGRPAYVVNDGIAALLGESKYGAAQHKKNVVMLTLGTGVGGAILIDGKPYQGAGKKAGHIGHMVVDCNGDSDVAGMPGSLEACFGSYSVEKRSGGRFKSTRELIDAVRQHDAGAKEIWLTSVKHLALALSSVSNILSPDLIILGGGVAEAGEDLFIPLQKFMNVFEWQPNGEAVEIVKARYGDKAGALGAACFAMQQHGLQVI
ncbi:MAG: ROK family protein [Niabella sp.]